MKLTSLLALLLLLGGCTYALDHEAFARASSQHADANYKCGADAQPTLSVKPGKEHYIPNKGPRGARQLHMYSKHRDQTTVIDGDQLRKRAIVVVIATYPGHPPPPPELTREKTKKKK
ncbi:MAG: hypothetical protein ACYTG3_07915 [Planctomycetota bacterium]|jgi:hypothetical protein